MDIAEKTSRVNAIYENDLNNIALRTDRLFFWLLIGQWVFAVAMALVWSPRTWIAQYWSIHQHMLAAALLGGLFCAYPLYLIRREPGAVFTRHMVAVAQMLQSALLVHVTGGRVETHFHVFGSLAILSFYRDWRVLITASAVVYLDHLALGAWFPLAVYGQTEASVWRSLEHAAWVIFIDAFLFIACKTGRRELYEIAERQVRIEETVGELQHSNEEIRNISAKLQESNQSLEKRVQERTEQLRKAKEGLEIQVQERTRDLIKAKEGLEEQVQQRTAELQQANNNLHEKVSELELLNKIMMGREERILELKKELEALRPGSA